MYRWKCWHDSRDRLVLYAGGCLAVGAIMSLGLWGEYSRYVAWIAVSTNPRVKLWDPSVDIWLWGMRVLLEFLLPAVLWAALAFGFMSVGREYDSGAMAFVLTRPQKRWRIVWDEWLLAVAEICIVLSMLIVGMAPILYLISKIYVSFTGLILPGALAVAACIYGLTQFLTLLTGSSAKGLSASVAAILFYVFLPGALNDWWHISWPLRIADLSLSVFDIGWQEPPRSFPSLNVGLLWFLVALIFPFLSQWLIERREV
ncbi:MAG TPA: ABC transporter permease subunit [Terriglobia bacterium]|nr:ABC transporter permease subunit [Terriglobia bacterium]